MRWILYNALFAVAYLAMTPKFLLRMRKRGGYRAHFAERFGRYDPETARRLAEKPRVWVHAVSVGEANLAGTILKELRRRDPAASFILSTTSSTGRAVCERLVGPDDVCVYLPLDFPPCVRRALRAANVRAMVLVEAELWPNLLRALHRRGVPLLLANGRISDRSAPGYRRLRFFFGPVLRLFDALLVQSELDRDRLLAAGAPADRTRVTGSVKFDIAPPPPDKLARARSILAAGDIEPGRDLVLLGGSTWPGEELILAHLFWSLWMKFRSLRLVLVPRHAERADEIAEELERAGYTVRRVSKSGSEKLDQTDSWDKEVEHPPILLVDVTGVLFPLYAFADVVFVGKTLAPNTGGQNMIEPCSFGKPVVVGPHTENFAPVMETLRKANAIIEVPDGDEVTLGRELGLHLDLCLRKRAGAAVQDDLGARAAAAVEGSRGALARTCDAIESVLAAH